MVLHVKIVIVEFYFATGSNLEYWYMRNDLVKEKLVYMLCSYMHANYLYLYVLYVYFILAVASLFIYTIHVQYVSYVYGNFFCTMGCTISVFILFVLHNYISSYK